MAEGGEITTQDLIDQLYERHDAEVHEIFSRLMGQAALYDTEETKNPSE